jgi:hypothetical protein
MNIKNIKKAGLSVAILATGLIALMIGLMATTASARMVSTTRIASTTMRVSSTTRQKVLANRQNQAIGLIDSKSVQEITSRITSLGALSTRLTSMKNLSASELSTLSGEITTLTGELTGLQAKIQADASSTPVGTSGALGSSSPLRQDFSSITKAYRVYALVIPQTQILAAADRVNTIITSLTTLSAKLQSRLSAAQSNGTTVGMAGTVAVSFASLQSDLTDLNAKTVDAQKQATAAVAAVSTLVPDNGNITVAASNTTTLKTGRGDIETAQKDIATADKDVHTIVAALEGVHASPITSTTTSISASASSTVSNQ